jgi:hypothetical protein
MRLVDEIRSAVRARRDLGALANFAHVWPGGDAESFGAAQRYAVAFRGGEVELVVARGEHHTFGQLRPRVVVFMKDAPPREGSPQAAGRVFGWKNYWPALEFIGVDDFERKRDLVCVLKKPGSHRHLPFTDDLPPEYRTFRTAMYSAKVSGIGAYKSWAAVVHEDDLTTLLELALLRACEHHQKGAGG